MRTRWGFAAVAVACCACGLGVDWARYTREAPDASLDAALPSEASTMNDAGATDAAGDVSFCAARDAAYCTEMAVLPVQEGWTLDTKADGGISLTTVAALSPPTAMLAEVSAGLGPFAYVYRSFTNAKKVKVELGVRALLADPGPNAAVAVASVLFGASADPGQMNDLRLYAYRGRFKVEEHWLQAGEGYRTHVDEPLDLESRFAHFQITIDAERDQATVSFDGQTRSFGLVQPMNEGVGRVQLGSVFGVDSVLPWQIAIDDVAVYVD